MKQSIGLGASSTVVADSGSQAASDLPVRRSRILSDTMQLSLAQEADKSQKQRNQRIAKSARELQQAAAADIAAGTVGRDSFHYQLQSAAISAGSAARAAVPAHYRPLLHQYRHCSTCYLQDGHNCQTCTSMTVYSQLQVFIRNRPGFYKSVDKLTEEELDTLAMAQHHEIAVHEDPARSDPIYDDGFEPATFHGPLPVDIDLTSDNDDNTLRDEAKTDRSIKQSGKRATDDGGDGDEDDDGDDDDSDDERWERIPNGRDRWGKPKFKRRRRGKSQSQRNAAQSPIVLNSDTEEQEQEQELEAFEKRVAEHPAKHSAKR